MGGMYNFWMLKLFVYHVSSRFYDDYLQLNYLDSCSESCCYSVQLMKQIEAERTPRINTRLKQFHQPSSSTDYILNLWIMEQFSLQILLYWVNCYSFLWIIFLPYKFVPYTQRERKCFIPVFHFSYNSTKWNAPKCLRTVKYSLEKISERSLSALWLFLQMLQVTWIVLTELSSHTNSEHCWHLQSVFLSQAADRLN